MDSSSYLDDENNTVLNEIVFDREMTDNVLKGHDAKIMQTIGSEIVWFINEFKSIVMCICSDKDRSAKSRSILFKRLMQKSKGVNIYGVDIVVDDFYRDYVFIMCSSEDLTQTKFIEKNVEDLLKAGLRQSIKTIELNKIS